MVEPFFLLGHGLVLGKAWLSTGPCEVKKNNLILPESVFVEEGRGVDEAARREIHRGMRGGSKGALQAQSRTPLLFVTCMHFAAGQLNSCRKLVYEIQYTTGGPERRGFLEMFSHTEVY